MANIFINAKTARENTRNQTVIHAEIRALENAVLTQIEAGELQVVVTSGTPMTDGIEYYSAYYGIQENRSLLDQIDFVTRYFKDLGYGVKIFGNENTQQNLIWQITW